MHNSRHSESGNGSRENLNLSESFGGSDHGSVWKT
jgi:hypothetical protein